MKLTLLQWSSLIAGVIFFFAVFLDIVDVINVPGRVLIVVPIVLFVVSWLVGPSLKDIKRANRRGR